MPVFADLAAMQARFEERDLIELSDQQGTGVMGADRIDQALVRADGQVRGYVAARHADADSLAGTGILTDIACDLAFADLWRSDQPDWVKDRRKAAIEQLKDIAAGKIKLDGGTEEAAPRPGQILTSGADRLLGRDSLGGF